MAEENFAVSGARAITIRRILMEDVETLTQWKEIKNEFIKRTMDRVEVNRMLDSEQPKYGRAILRSLEVWSSTQPEQARYDNLVEILRKHLPDTNTLSDKLKTPEIRKQIHDAGLTESVVEQDPRFPVPNFAINFSGLFEICSTVCDDKEAVRKWSMVKDVMVKAVNSNLQIDFRLDTGGVEVFSAVSDTISSWISTQADKATFHKLLSIFADHGLISLKDELMSPAVVSKLRQLEGCDLDPESAAAAKSGTDNKNREDQTEELRYHVCPSCKSECWDHMIKCGHFLCEKCLDKFLQSKPNCPICREPFKALDVTRTIVPY